MTTEDKTKRIFFKKAAAAAGFVSAAAYLGNLMSAHSNSIARINEHSTNDVNLQKKAWLQKQWVPMTNMEKKHMLDEILDMHKQSET